MEVPLRTVLIDWLAGDPTLAASLNAIVEERPSRTSLPWLAIATSAAADWSGKTHRGNEVRIALEMHTRTDLAGADASLVAMVMDRIEQLPRDQTGFAVVTIRFLRSRTEQRAESERLTLLEYAFRTLAD